MNSKSLTKLIAVFAIGTALIASPAFAAGNPNSEGPTNPKAIDSPGFDARGEALEKVISISRGNTPLGVPNNQASPRTSTTSNGISYRGGPVMTDVNGVKINIIWYGTWTTTQKTILRTMVNGLSGSKYYNINTTYYDASKKYVKNLISVSSEMDDAYSQGNGATTALSDAQIWSIVSAASTTNALIKDTNAITLVLTSADVKKSGFITSYCGWHSFNTLSATSIKYSFVGNPGTNSSCAVQSVSPNGDMGVDAMASVVAHEIVEAVTDPQLNAWYDSRGYENADKCAWKFGTTTTTSTGAWNMTLGGKNYLIQQNWRNSSGGACVLSY